MLLDVIHVKTDNVFQGAFVKNGTVVWPGNIDIDPEPLYDCSVPLASNKGAGPIDSVDQQPWRTRWD